MATLSDVILEVRTMIDDISSPASNFIRKENLRQSVNGDQVDGSNKDFIINHKRIITSTLVVTADGAIVTPSAIDYSRGLFTLSSAPTTTLFVKYDYNHLTDAEITEHISDGQRFVGYETITDVPFGLLTALEHKATADAFEQFAARTAQLFDASAGGKTLSKASIKSHYLELAKYHHSKAEDERTAYYQRQGRRDAPSYGAFAIKQSPFTPRR